MSAEARIAELGLTLPDAPRPMASYVTAARSGDLVFT
ncbi:MAG: YjgF/chorismate mutase-like, putative endoribonuclease, partial [Acidimicrobiia bacterium]|nr:YjgF/chorismate mutase-like, putative endoribonuclease [Acidimicrobiia bacterium]